MQRSGSRTDDSELLVFAAVFEQLAELMHPEHYNVDILVIDSGFVAKTDEVVMGAVRSGAFGDDPLLTYVVKGLVDSHFRCQATGPVHTGVTYWLLHRWLPIVVRGFPDTCSLDPGALTEWFRAGFVQFASIIRWRIGAFVGPPLQRNILKALSGRALTKMALAKEVCGGEQNGNILYRPGGIREMRLRGLVRLKRGLGFYRPDAPPPGFNPSA